MTSTPAILSEALRACPEADLKSAERAQLSLEEAFQHIGVQGASMRNIVVFLGVAWLVSIEAAAGQTVGIQAFGSAGTPLGYAGTSFVVGAGISPSPRITFLFGVERTHLSSWTHRTNDSMSSFRGGTDLIGTATLRGAIGSRASASRGSIQPFWLAGAGAGQSRPNVNQHFSNPVTNNVFAIFGGGGVDIVLSRWLSVYAELRPTVVAERDVAMVMVPLRAGIAIHFDSGP